MPVTATGEAAMLPLLIVYAGHQQAQPGAELCDTNPPSSRASCEPLTPFGRADVLPLTTN